MWYPVWYFRDQGDPRYNGTSTVETEEFVLIPGKGSIRPSSRRSVVPSLNGCVTTELLSPFNSTSHWAFFRCHSLLRHQKMTQGIVHHFPSDLSPCKRLTR